MMYGQQFQREDRWGITYTLNGTKKYCVARGKEQKDKNLETIRSNSKYGLISCEKLYPFSMDKNQHNFDLIANVTFNRMYDMQEGKIEWNDKEYEELEELHDEAVKFFGYGAGIAWMPYKELVRAKEIAAGAILHREKCCIENGRLDLLQYCD